MIHLLSPVWIRSGSTPWPWPLRLAVNVDVSFCFRFCSAPDFLLNVSIQYPYDYSVMMQELIYMCKLYEMCVIVCYYWYYLPYSTSSTCLQKDVQPYTPGAGMSLDWQAPGLCINRQVIYDSWFRYRAHADQCAAHISSQPTPQCPLVPSGAWLRQGLPTGLETISTWFAHSVRKEFRLWNLEFRLATAGVTGFNRVRWSRIPWYHALNGNLDIKENRLWEVSWCKTKKKKKKLNDI